MCYKIYVGVESTPLCRNPVVLTQQVVDFNHCTHRRKSCLLKPGNANQEIGVPGLILRVSGIRDAQF
jgi:hypothetical protein